MGLMTNITAAAAFFTASDAFATWIGYVPAAPGETPPVEESGPEPADCIIYFNSDEEALPDRFVALYHADYKRDNDSFDSFADTGSVVLHFEQLCTAGQATSDALKSLAENVDLMMAEIEEGIQSGWAVGSWAPDPQDPYRAPREATRDSVTLRITVEPLQP